MVFDTRQATGYFFLKVNRMSFTPKKATRQCVFIEHGAKIQINANIVHAAWFWQVVTLNVSV
ncbi:hypothetical protein A0O30_19790 [Pseudomonas sp. LLC-1]|nr:hypothetical protein A0O30_19790 [Pseudomonas sp. LLC-1]